jgi:hypothetical protein
LNSLRLISPAGTDAMQSAPIVDSGETSTRWPAMFIVDAIPSALSTPRFSTRPGTVGRKAGSTTPDVLE